MLKTLLQPTGPTGVSFYGDLLSYRRLEKLYHCGSMAIYLTDQQMEPRKGSSRDDPAGRTIFWDRSPWESIAWLESPHEIACLIAHLFL